METKEERMETKEERMETRTTIISTASARAAQGEDLAALAAGWPEFRAAEVRRLHVLAYRHATGHLRPAGLLHAAGARVCEELAASLRAPTPPTPPTPPMQEAVAPGVPPLWRAWMADHGPAVRWPKPQI